MKWFAIQYDRNYQTSEYGNGNEIYIEEKSNNQNFIKLKFGVIKTAKYDSGSMDINVKFNDSEILEKITLNTEPDQELFQKTHYNDWKLWDTKYGKYDENRIDYEPWSFNSLKSLAVEMNCYETKDNVKLYWNKPYTTYS